MAPKPNPPSEESAGGPGPGRGPSRKDEIIQQIRNMEDKRRTAPSAAGATDRADDTGASTYGGRDTGTGYGPGGRADAPRARRAPVFGGAGAAAMAIYCRQLATLLDVGIPLLRALQLLGERTSNPRLRATSADLARRVEEGQPLSAAMEAHPAVFDHSFTGVVRSGEAGGILEESMRRLADLLERRSALKKKVVGALVYPVVCLVVMLTVIGIICFYALPKLIATFPAGTELPLATRLLMGFVTWTTANAVLMVILIAVAVAAIVWFLRSPAGSAAYESTMLRLPVIGPLMRKINVARFARTLGSLTAAGIPLLDALAICADTAENGVVERTLHRVRQNVERGGKMEEPMRQEPVFDPIVVDMVMVGDEAGALDTMMLKVADTYDQEVDGTLKTITGLLEPLLVIFMGFVVLLLFAAVLAPYFKRLQMVGTND